MSPSVTVASSPAPAGRLVSLDVLRGITIAFMILVNSSTDSSYWPLRHSDWNGWTPTDLVFPTFLFLVGASIVFSFESRLAQGLPISTLLLRAMRRAAILFLLGLVVNGFPFFHLQTLRIYGVLQRIAICYLAASLLYLRDRRPAPKVVLIVAALAGYWILMRWIPVPGYGFPGHGVPFLDKNANLAAWIDRQIFPGRLYEVTRDPEGLLSTLPALATTLLGMLTGMWLRTARSPQRKCGSMLAAGVFLVALGELWSPWFPINKKLWTSSYVLFAAGIALIAWALLYWAIEIKRWNAGGWKGAWTTFWLVFGVNAITAYVFSELLSSALWAIRLGSRSNPAQWINRHFVAPVHPPAVAALLYSICFVLLCWLPVLALYRKGIVIKV